MEQYSTDQIWVGLDVHQSSVTAAALYGDSHDPEVVRMRGDLNAVRKFFRRLSQDGTPEAVTRHPERATSCSAHSAGMASTARS